MKWEIKFDSKAEKELKKLDKSAQTRILNYIEERLVRSPLDFGENLKEIFHGLRRYRIGYYRLICEIQEEIITILIVKIGHRKNSYKN